MTEPKIGMFGMTVSWGRVGGKSEIRNPKYLSLYSNKFSRI
jgi:hypothetical protein